MPTAIVQIYFDAPSEGIPSGLCSRIRIVFSREMIQTTATGPAIAVTINPKTHWVVVDPKPLEFGRSFNFVFVSYLPAQAEWHTVTVSAAVGERLADARCIRAGGESRDDVAGKD